MNRRTAAARSVGLRLAPVPAAGIAEGAVFRSVSKGGVIGERLWPEDVPRIYRSLAKRAGLDTTGISGHSTRVGAAQDLTAAGFGLAEIMHNGRWKTGEMLMRYTEAEIAEAVEISQPQVKDIIGNGKLADSDKPTSSNLRGVPSGLSEQ